MARPVRRAFVLLEVLIALVILSVSLVALLRGFALAIKGVKENAVYAKAAVLAETLLHDFELEPPRSSLDLTSFADDTRFGDAFEHYYYEYEVEDETTRYRTETRGKPLQDLEPIYRLNLRIVYDDGRMERSLTAFSVSTFLVETQVWSEEAMQANQLF